jgi:hypothetical protein
MATGKNWDGETSGLDSLRDGSGICAGNGWAGGRLSYEQSSKHRPAKCWRFIESWGKRSNMDPFEPEKLPFAAGISRLGWRSAHGAPQRLRSQHLLLNGQRRSPPSGPGCR